MNVYEQDFNQLKVGDPCFVMEQVIPAGRSDGPLVRFYFAKVTTLPTPGDKYTGSIHDGIHGKYYSGAYTDIISPVGVADYRFTQVLDYGTHSNFFGDDTFMLPDTPAVRNLIHTSLHLSKSADSWRWTADARTKTFTDMITSVIKNLTVPEPIRKLMEKLLDRKE
jgi:hypothetical protein